MPEPPRYFGDRQIRKNAVSIVTAVDSTPPAGWQTRGIADDEREWLRGVLRERWGSEEIAGRGRLLPFDELHAMVAIDELVRLGVATYVLEGASAEIVTLDSFHEGHGIGSGLIEAVADAAREAGARELFVMTTNDNLRALRLYQRRGFHLHELRAGAVERARHLKPSIPMLGNDGIPIRDEIDLVRVL
jgi:DNA-3-methyladenine glycosylase I